MDTKQITELGRLRDQVARLDVDAAAKTKLLATLDAEIHRALTLPERSRPPRKARSS